MNDLLLMLSGMDETSAEFLALPAAIRAGLVNAKRAITNDHLKSIRQKRVADMAAAAPAWLKTKLEAYKNA